MRYLLFFFVFIIIILSLTFVESSNAQFDDSTALFVVADAAALNNAESAIITRLEDMMFYVDVIGQNDASDDLTEGMALVLISATVSSGTITTNMPGLIDLEIPVINWEPFLDDLLGYSELDGGEFNTTEIDIILPEHPLAAGLEDGPVTITEVEKGVSYGVPVGDVDIIAVNPNDPNQAVLFGYEKGAETFAGNAPARRVGTFLLNDVADSMTEEGWLLFDATVNWAMGSLDTSAISVEEVDIDIPNEYVLLSNYPNPFNPATNIAFSIPEQSNVRISVWNSLGQDVVTLVDEVKTAGSYTVTFDAAKFSSGMYFYRLETDSHVITKKMLFLQ